MAEGNAIDWDAFEADPYWEAKQAKPQSEVRIGFLERTCLYTPSRSIAIFQDLESQQFKFCLLKGRCACDFNNSMLPVIIVIEPGTIAAKEIIAIRSINIYNLDDQIKKEGIEIVFNRNGEYAVYVYYDGRQQQLTNNEKLLLIWYILYQDYTAENKKARYSKPYLVPCDCRKKYQEIVRQVSTKSLDEIMMNLLLSDALRYLDGKKRSDIQEQLHSLSKENTSSELISFYLQKFIDLESTALYRDASQIKEFKKQLSLINSIEDENDRLAEQTKLLESFSRELYSELLFFQYVSEISGPVSHSVDKIETRLKMLERATNYWVFWKIKRSVLFSNYWDKFDKAHQRSGFDESDLSEANLLLSQKTQSIEELNDLELYEGIPQLDFL